MKKTSKIFVVGDGLVGSSLVKVLEMSGFTNIINPTKEELDLTRQEEVESFFSQNSPEYVIIAESLDERKRSAENSAEFIHDSFCIQTNIIDSSHRSGVKRLLFLGSSSVYPQSCPQPVRESYLLTSHVDEIEDANVMAKIVGVKMCQAYRKQYGFECLSVISTNLYGPKDDFDFNNFHLLSSLIRTFHEAKVEKRNFIEISGAGKIIQQFLYVDDLARSCILLLDTPIEEIDRLAPDGIINIGFGNNLTIKELADLLRKVIGYLGEVRFDTSKPDLISRKLLDGKILSQLGWKPETNLEEGIRKTYYWFLSNFYKTEKRSEISVSAYLKY